MIREIETMLIGVSDHGTAQYGIPAEFKNASAHQAWARCNHW